MGKPVKREYNHNNGIRFKKRSRPESLVTTWLGYDENFRSGMQFAKQFRRAMKRELNEFYTKDMRWQGKPYIICKHKESGHVSSFFIPFMSREYYEDFVAGMIIKLRESYEEFLDSKKE